MKLILKTHISHKSDYLNHDSSILSVGSCFSKEIGEKLEGSGFDIDVNPFGTIFNPHSILNSLTTALEGEVNSEQFLQRDQRHFSFDYHSDVSAGSETELLNQVNEINTSVANRLTSCSHLFITFGTAWAYKKSKNQIVANCHKVPSNEFEKVLLDKNDLLKNWSAFLLRLVVINPSIKILFTVSPVRHSKDGLRENNLSKGMLHQLVYDLEQDFDCIDYFPSYEILIDELRDYRFFKNDLVHPSELAIDYIYKQFKAAYFSKSTTEISDLSEKLNKAREHKFMNASDKQKEEHQAFIQRLEEQLRNIQA